MSKIDFPEFEHYISFFKVDGFKQLRTFDYMRADVTWVNPNIQDYALRIRKSRFEVTDLIDIKLDETNTLVKKIDFIDNIRRKFIKVHYEFQTMLKNDTLSSGSQNDIQPFPQHYICSEVKLLNVSEIYYILARQGITGLPIDYDSINDYNEFHDEIFANRYQFKAKLEEIQNNLKLTKNKATDKLVGFPDLFVTKDKFEKFLGVLLAPDKDVCFKDSAGKFHIKNRKHDQLVAAIYKARRVNWLNDNYDIYNNTYLGKTVNKFFNIPKGEKMRGWNNPSNIDEKMSAFTTITKY